MKGYGHRHDEWMAWRKIVEELTAIDIDINKQDALDKAIREWGEKYADWRTQYGNPTTTGRDVASGSGE